MTKTELALRYLPYYTAKAAVNRMMAWIRQCPELMNDLLASGYQSRQKNLTPQQVELIEQRLGVP